VSIFYCNRCDELRDADDGCDEVGGELVCVECAEECIEDNLNARTNEPRCEVGMVGGGH
jgi:hypothetical protein